MLLYAAKVDGDRGLNVKKSEFEIYFLLFLAKISLKTLNLRLNT